MAYKALGIIAFLILHAGAAWCENIEPDWSVNAILPVGGRSNPFQIPQEKLPQIIEAGKLHTLNYPVTVTAPLLPVNLLSKVFKNGLFSKKIFDLFPDFGRFKSADEIFEWLGLNSYPEIEQEGIYEIPYENGIKPRHRMGYTEIERYGVRGITFSCVACHSSNLFGKKVLGLTNRTSRANEVFFWGRTGALAVPTGALYFYPDISAGDIQLYKDLRKAVVQVGVKKPLALGLDTSLAQVALSLAHREKNSYADSNLKYALNPRGEILSHERADSKPSVWWNLKYKTRWLSDGAIVSGNPILTNFLWNEIGRGTDLHTLEKWVDSSRSIIEELTTAVFSTQAPPITDFFAADRISIDKARKGQKTFEQHCARCHGFYEKNWNSSEPLKTTEVRYPKHTHVIDVGTDAHRRQGMNSLTQLNNLEISQRNGIKVEPQIGYVPPPLVGIWARWPYFHNNSAPSLCAVLTRHEERPVQYYRGEPLNTERDFDFNCNGYPTGAAVPALWKENKENIFDTTRPGLSNAGHDEGIFLQNGTELLNVEEKNNLILFLQTL